ncbi:uncharacterized protein LOC134529470 isoform X2 [Bacillus rossius redtenbacheri]|uniref:uncharacterized protein LOC134529470 isoform X2 n=1 Tax=Bacillus rossius redtenbacheri TaxID=93214 RepID=UPI002FDCE9C0
MRQCISPRDRVAVTLRYLASGNSFMDLQYATRIPQCTLSKIVPETLNAICTVLKDEIKVPSTPSEWEAVSEQFHLQWNFPYCMGALDGKHINFRPSRSSGSYYHNYKGNNSIILLALVDANYKFLWVNIGVNGRVNDAGVFMDSNLKKALERNELGLPLAKPLPSGRISVPHVIVADDAFALSPNVMKPFPQRGLSYEQRVYNYRLSRARRCVENAFGILANRLLVLMTTIRLCPQKVDLIVNACVLLHNYILERKPNSAVEEELDANMQGASMRGLHCQQGGNRAPEMAYAIRNEFLSYFNGVGQVPWQAEAVHRGNM